MRAEFRPMFRLRGVLACAAALAAAELLPAQPPDPSSQLPVPRINTLLPCGGKAGTTFEVTFTGTDIEAPEELLFSHPGLKAEPIAAPAPKPDPKQPPPPPPKRGRPQSKVIASKFKITIPEGTPPGVHDVRLVNAWGISNPRAFVVGDLAEAMEKEPNDDVPQAQRVEINTTVNGTIQTPTDVDYFVFKGQRGQRVVVSCLATSLDSRLEAGLELYDAAGKRLAENRNYAGGDAVLDRTLEKDGDYLVRLFEFTHTQGSPEHYYRLSITTAPWIDAIHPSVVEPGKKSQVTLFGRNLPGGKPEPSAVLHGSTLETLTVTIDVPNEPEAQQRLAFSGPVSPPASMLDGFEYRIRNPAGISNPYLLTFARAPVVLDRGENDKLDAAQEIAVPCEIAGRIEKRRDRDWYAFTVKKGDVYSIEAFSDRLGAPTDLILNLYGPNKQQLSEVDDDAQPLNDIKFFTRSNDPARLRFVAQADGKHYLQVRSLDADLRAGPRDLYHVRIAPERPDFRLVVMAADDRRPDACRLMRGGEQYFSVFVGRLDDFEGEIILTAEGLPAGVHAPPQAIGPGQRQGSFVLSASASAMPDVHEIKIRGTATINGQTVVREARPASIVWPVQPQQQIPTQVRLDRSLPIAVSDQAPFQLSASLEKDMLLQGEKANVNLKLTRHWADFKTPVQLSYLEPPRVRNQPDFIIPNTNLAPGKDDGKLTFDVKSALAPGTYTVVLRAFAALPYAKDPMAKQKPNINVALPSTPLTFTVVPKELAKVQLPATVTANTGALTEVPVQLARQFGYAGEFKLELIVPAGLKGVSAAPATVAAGQGQGKLVLKVEPDAAPGSNANFLVRATALYNGKVAVTQDVKLTVNVVKK